MTELIILLACLCGATLMLTILVSIVVLVFAVWTWIGDLRKARRDERRMEAGHAHAQAYCDPSLIDDADIDFEHWPVLAAEPPAVPTRRRKAA
jgi:hypothetical protein